MSVSVSYLSPAACFGICLGQLSPDTHFALWLSMGLMMSSLNADDISRDDMVPAGDVAGLRYPFPGAGTVEYTRLRDGNGNPVYTADLR
ncbi:MAG: hypothetical protein U0U70_12915 [Chitinophagaceae bacterium]